jgi:hypothetical protein
MRATPVDAARCVLVALTLAFAVSQGAHGSDDGVRELGRHGVLAEGPELTVALGFRQAARSLGEEWLILAVELTAAPRGGVVSVDRSDIQVITPDGRRLALANQEEFRAAYGEVRIRVDRALDFLPVLARYDESRMPCDRWFLVDPFSGFAVDELGVNTFQVCSGPLVFRVAGGVQPGRWRLVIDLAESRVDIPFELEAED